jgi:hypothetical protein
LDPAIALFNIFVSNEYDMLQYRFFNVLLDRSLGAVTPSISDLMKTESLTESDTELTLPASNARQIYTDIFPFDAEPHAFGDDDDVVLFWDLMHVCIKKFDACRQHLWNVVKSGFSVSDCSDLNHITPPHFRSFAALVLPDRTPGEVRQLWTDINTRNRALGNETPLITFADITYMLTHRENFFFAAMRIKLLPSFSVTFHELNASMLKALAFVLNRLVYSVPALDLQAGDSREKVRRLAVTLRGCLFMCDVAGAFLQYRAMLHVVDGVLVADGSSMMVSNRNSAAEVEALLRHFLDREKAIGLVQVERPSKEERSSHHLVVGDDEADAS